MASLLDMTQFSPKATDILKEMLDFLRKRAPLYIMWTVDTVTDPKELFEKHGIDETSDKWICFDAGSEEEARQIKEAIIFIGCQGTSDNGKDDSYRYVYIFFNAHKKPTQ